MIRNPMKPKNPRKKKCPYCKEQYQPAAGLQVNCCQKFECKAAFMAEHVAKARARRKREEADAAKEARKAIRQAKEKLKRRSEWIQETQRVVNALRRHEELAKGRGCISCGRSQEEVQETDGWKPGGAWDAGHFMSVGSMPAKRFTLMNIWLQCKSCNAGSSKYARKGATVSRKFKTNLIALIGLGSVEELERDCESPKWTIEDLKAIKADAVRKLKALRASMEVA